MPGTKQKIEIKDVKGKMSQTQKYKVWAFHEVCDELGLPFRNDLGGKNGVEVKEAILQRIEEKTNEPSEEEVIFMDGVDVTLGGKKYHVKRLPAAKDREWKRQVAVFIQDIIGYFKEAGIDPEKVGKDDKEESGKALLDKAIPYIMTDGLDGLVELFWAYAVDLDREKIEAESTIYSDEINDAALGVFEMMLPFFIGQIKRMLKLVKRTGVLRELLNSSV